MPTNNNFFCRYVVLRVVLEDDLRNSQQNSVSLTGTAIYQCIVKLVQKYYGDVGVGAVRTSLKAKYCNDQTRIAIIRVKHKAHRFVTSILPLASVISGVSNNAHT